MSTVHVYVRTQTNTNSPDAIEAIRHAFDHLRALVEAMGAEWRGSLTVEAEP